MALPEPSAAVSYIGALFTRAWIEQYGDRFPTITYEHTATTSSIRIETVNGTSSLITVDQDAIAVVTDPPLSDVDLDVESEFNGLITQLIADVD